MTHSLWVRMEGGCKIAEVGASSLFGVKVVAGARSCGEAAEAGDDTLDEAMSDVPGWYGKRMAICRDVVI